MIDNKVETFSLGIQLSETGAATLLLSIQRKYRTHEPLVVHKDLINFKKGSLSAFPQSHRSLPVTLMKVQVKNLNMLNRVLWRDFSVNCHFYTVTLESMRDLNLLMVNHISLGFKVATQVPLHLHVSFTSTGSRKTPQCKGLQETLVRQTRNKPDTRAVKGITSETTR